MALDAAAATAISAAASDAASSTVKSAVLDAAPVPSSLSPSFAPAPPLSPSAPPPLPPPPTFDGLCRPEDTLDLLDAFLVVAGLAFPVFVLLVADVTFPVFAFVEVASDFWADSTVNVAEAALERRLVACEQKQNRAVLNDLMNE